MAGHSHWAGIKHKKEAEDKKRGQIFSKILSAITAAAKLDPNPNFNPKLRSLIEKAKDLKVPQDNIQRAISKATEKGNTTEELILEAYGPGGTAILIEAITDNKNRTIAEIKNILNENGAKWAEQGSVRWAFEETQNGWQVKFKNDISENDKLKLNKIINELENHSDVQQIYTNSN
ncbi:MAG: YebC/PmpR family DNA-binding transcriptional regulator [Patescibacteria group bacterium]|nr:YebC/PmpR family DNA-binding transcriptional regulator [Patescibacteria group bacterium]MCX7589725.1 YebC/PmpR family DNA-binding transcriptional regulator [Patescibacteria group bacterium]MDW8279916.1 YebC/PmpR family DNA-binding transcriptional regulator [bacterium]